jgi:hypothetical protein
LRAFLAETVTLEARFSQVLLEADSAHAQVSEGSFYLHRPQRFRWDYESPAPQLVVADGEHLWLYDPDLEQVTVRRLDDGLSSTPAMLLSGDGVLEDSFRLGAAIARTDRLGGAGAALGSGRFRRRAGRLPARACWPRWSSWTRSARRRSSASATSG